MPDQADVLDILSPVPIGLDRNGGYNLAGSSIEGVVRQGNILAIDQPSALQHPLEQELFVKPGIHDALLVPLKIGGVVTGILALGAFRADALNGFEEQVEEIASLLPLAIEKNRLSSSVNKRDQEMASIQQIGSILAAATFDRQEVLKHTMDMIRTIVNVEAGSLLLLEGDELAFKVAFNVDPAIDTTSSTPSVSVSVRESPAIPPPAASRSSSGMRRVPGISTPISTGRPVSGPVRRSACRSSPGERSSA